MSNDIHKLLEEAGWYEGRRIDISYMIEDLKARELTGPNPLINKLWEEYWNIKIEFITPTGMSGDITLNYENALGISNRLLQQYETLLGDNLVPSGSINEDSGALFVSYSGKFYLAANQNLYQIGIDFFNALDVIINEKDVLRLI